MIKGFVIFILAFLPNLIKANENITKEVDSLIQLSNQYKSEVQIEFAVEVAFRALEKSLEINYSRGVALSYLNIAQAYFYLGKYENSLEYLSLSEDELYSTDNLIILFEISRIRGQIFTYMKLENQSIGEFQKCITIANKIESKEERNHGLSLSYENLSTVYSNFEKPDSVYYYMYKNKLLLESMNEEYIYRNLVNLYTSFGGWYSNEGEYNLADVSFNKALDLANKYNYQYQSRTLMFIGDFQDKKGNQDSAFYYYHKALENLEITKIKGEFSLIYNKLSNLHESIGEADLARIYKDKEILIDTELAAEKQKSTAGVLEVLIKEERIIQEKQRNKVLLFVFISFVLIITFTVLFWKSTRRKYLESKKRLSSELNKTIKEFDEIQQESQLLVRKINESFGEVVGLAKNNDPLFLKRFQEVYPEFTDNLNQIHPDLTNSELILCALLYLNFSTKDIATCTYVEHRSVQTKKSRLRKKLNLPKGSNITNYLYTLNGL